MAVIDSPLVQDGRAAMPHSLRNISAFAPGNLATAGTTGVRRMAPGSGLNRLMGNKLTPRKVSLGANVLTRLDAFQKRQQMLVMNDTGFVIGLTSDAEETDIANCYPIEDGVEFIDNSSSAIYGISETGGDVWVWETEA